MRFDDQDDARKKLAWTAVRTPFHKRFHVAVVVHPLWTVTAISLCCCVAWDSLTC